MILDGQRLDELRQLCAQSGQEALFGQMVQQFVQSLHEAMAELEALGDDKSPILHALKGRCGTMGATALAQAVDMAENTELDQQDAMIEQVKVLIEQSIDELLKTIEKRDSEG